MDAVLHESPDYVARAQSLGPALAEAADDIERNRELPASIVSALIDNGLFRLLQPRSLGGAELDPMTTFAWLSKSPAVTPAPAGVSNRQTAARWLPPILSPRSRKRSSGRRTASSPGARSGRPSYPWSPAGSA